jgi:[acyl-carrier-protein] S-malonyltransferase
MSVALVFPGQGSQKVGMGRPLVDAFPESRAVFDEADSRPRLALSRLCFEGPSRAPAHRQHAARASWPERRRAGARSRRAACAPDFVAGHSLGEYSALVAAGRSARRGARAVRRRGQYMQEAVPAGTGDGRDPRLDLAQDRGRVREAAQGEVVAPANLNAPAQVVIAGHARRWIAPSQPARRVARAAR